MKTKRGRELARLKRSAYSSVIRNLRQNKQLTGRADGLAARLESTLDSLEGAPSLANRGELPLGENARRQLAAYQAAE